MKLLENPNETPLQQLIGYKVLDHHGEEIGTLRSLYSAPETGKIDFLVVGTDGLFGRDHMVPAENVEWEQTARALRVPYPGAVVKGAPTVSADSGITETTCLAQAVGTTATLTVPPGNEITASHEDHLRRYYATAESADVLATSIEPGGTNFAGTELPEAGAHTVGAGLGALGAGLAGAAIGGAIGGPIGAPIGAVIGAIVGGLGGGLTGKEIVEAIAPDDDETLLQANLRKAPYFQDGYDLSDYAPAYKVGFEGFRQSTHSGCGFNEMETDLRCDYEQTRGVSRLDWEDAKAAVHDAWMQAEAKAAANKLE